MFALRNIINHELYTNDIELDKELTHGIGGWVKKEEIEGKLDEIITKRFGK